MRQIVIAVVVVVLLTAARARALSLLSSLAVVVVIVVGSGGRWWQYWWRAAAPQLVQDVDRTFKREKEVVKEAIFGPFVFDLPKINEARFRGRGEGRLVGEA
jgi:hypothetical protein